MSARKRFVLLTALAVFAPLSSHVQSATTAEADRPSSAALRERLTEREDRRRRRQPFQLDLGRHPLILEGEYELTFEGIDGVALGQNTRGPQRALLAQELEAEAFYSIGRLFSIFAQARLGMSEDLLTGDAGTSEHYIERGEFWIHSEEIAGSNVNLEVGRLNFEDDRRWWWEAELDALRLTYEGTVFEIEVAVAEELGAVRSDESGVAPEEVDLTRVLASLEWTWAEDHSAQLFALHHVDHSARDPLGSTVLLAKLDDSDARLNWLGGRLIGGLAVSTAGILGYWLDAATVRGHEHSMIYSPIGPNHALASELARSKMNGWALDLGVNWLMPLRFEPRVFFGVALGSGDDSPSDGKDQAFRQTSLHANEAGFGGVRRFPHYGAQLAPELSNLTVWTLGAGRRLFASSSIDVVYHHYRLAERAESLRNANLDTEFDSLHRTVGDGLDIVVAIEEWERFELEFTAATFRAGSAFGAGVGEWSHGAEFAVRVAF